MAQMVRRRSKRHWCGLLLTEATESRFVLRTILQSGRTAKSETLSVKTLRSAEDRKMCLSLQNATSDVERNQMGAR